MSVRILLLGSGGREHALAWKLARSPILDHIYVCPGNAGTQQEPKTSNVNDISPADFPNLVDFALKHKVRHSSQLDPLSITNFQGGSRCTWPRATPSGWS